MVNKRAVGSLFELEAEKYLVGLGYQLIDKNIYTVFGELDLIMQKEEVLFFVEVKYRSNTNYGTPREALTPKKIQHLKRASQQYLKTYPKKTAKYKIAFLGILKIQGQLQFDFIENILT